MKKLLLILMLISVNSFATKNKELLNKSFNFAVATGSNLNETLIDRVDEMTSKEMKNEIEYYNKIRKDKLKRIK